MANLFITDTTVGREVMSRLSEGERECIREGLGEAVYSAVLILPMKRLINETGSNGAGSFLGCLTEDNVILMALVLVDANSGRVDLEARECRIAVARANPDYIRIRYELLRPDFATLDADAVLQSTKDAFDCLSVTDRVNVLVRLTRSLDQEDTTLDVDQLEESELAQLGNDAAKLFECLNEDEILQVLTLRLVAES